MRCKICNKNFKHLGSHVWHAHKMLAIEYKEEFGLDHSFALIDDDIKLKKQIAFAKRREYYLGNLAKSENKHKFKKGVKNLHSL